MNKKGGLLTVVIFARVKVYEKLSTKYLIFSRVRYKKNYVYKEILIKSVITNVYQKSHDELGMF